MQSDGGDLARTRRLGLARLESAVRKEIVQRGRQRPCLRIVRQLFAALSDPAHETRAERLRDDFEARLSAARK